MSQRAILDICLAGLLALPAPGWSQSNPVPQARGLKVTVVRGEGAVNQIGGKVDPLVVDVIDDSEKPVAGAEVVFQLPTMGPSGTFYGWLRTHTTRTDAQGRASSAPFSPSNEEGRFEVVVTASANGRQGTVRIAQSNTRSGTAVSAKSSHKKVWIVLAVVAAGAIGGGVAASRRGGDTAAPVTTPVTVAPGVVTVGGPR